MARRVLVTSADERGRVRGLEDAVTGSADGSVGSAAVESEYGAPVPLEGVLSLDHFCARRRHHCSMMTSPAWALSIAA